MMRVTTQKEQDLINKIFSISAQSPDIEVCGIVINGQVFESDNIAGQYQDLGGFEPDSGFVPQSAQLDFALDDRTTDIFFAAKSEGLKPLIYHSHVNDVTTLSVPDVMLAKRLGVPILMVHPRTSSWDYFDPLEARPYIGRNWQWVHSNCYSLAQDYYQREHKITLKDFYLEHPTAWEDPRWSMYVDELPGLGFIDLGRDAAIQDGDLVLMWIGRADTPNHCAVVWDATNNKILHQVSGRLSTIEDYKHGYKRATTSIYRHKELLNAAN